VKKLLCFACLLLVGCSPADQLRSLRIAAVAVSRAKGAIVFVEDTALRGRLTVYLDSSSKALAEAATYLESGTITKLQIATIVNNLTSNIFPALPDSVPRNVKIILLSANAATTVFLASLYQLETTSISLTKTDRKLLAETKSILEGK
jgi:hypothetical protein